MANNSVEDYSIEDLQYLMSRLRDPEDGCPWDLEQDFASIAPHTLEESYELVDAIEQGDYQQIKEELGDVLFQVIFYTQLGQEQKQFDFSGVVSTLVEKLIRRHPHVFPAETLASRAGEQTTVSATVKKNWEVLKAAERQGKAQHSVLDDVPVSLPALTRAAKLQKRAANVGFDWNHPDEVIEHIQQEMQELTEARAQGDQAAIQEEFGDLLFCCINLARHLKVDPETALRGTNRKFENRFAYIEEKLREAGTTPQEADLEVMDKLWNQAKLTGL